MPAFYEQSNFKLLYWLDGETQCGFENLPFPPDKYKPNSENLSWGRDLSRGRSIQNARYAKALKTNREFFIGSVLPLIRDRLNSTALFDLSKDIESSELFNLSGFTIYEIGGVFGCVHPKDDERHRRASELGASVVGLAWYLLGLK